MSTLPSYGAVKASGDDAAVDRSFNADNAYYLKDGERNLTFQQRLKKLAMVVVPLLTAALIIGGAAVFLLRDFNHLYPGRGGDTTQKTPAYHSIRTGTKSLDSSGDDFTPSGNAPPTPPNTATSTGKSSEKASSNKSSSSSGGVSGNAACSAHPGCAENGLTGDCCPTSIGDMLDCCSAN
jgi:hypothetical protein